MPIPSSGQEPFFLTRSQAWSLYALQSFTSWNTRTYDFAAIVFTASIYPKKLTAASVRGLSYTIACVIFSSMIGRWVDQSTSRLRGVWISIWTLQISFLLAYILWYLIGAADTFDFKDEEPSYGIYTHSMFALIVMIGVIAKLGDILNDLAITREWLPVLAPSSMAVDSKTAHYDLTHLNAVLRRIDLTFKIFIPLLFNYIILALGTPLITMIMLIFITCISLAVELKLANDMYKTCSALQSPKVVSSKEQTSEHNEGALWLDWCKQGSAKLFEAQMTSLHEYFSTDLWMPSISSALLHLTVLAYSASLLTHMQEVGLSWNTITIAQASGSVLDVIGTIVTPVIIHHLSRVKTPSSSTSHIDEEDPETKGSEISIDSSTLEKVGLGGVSWQLICLALVVVALFCSPISTSTVVPPASILLFVFLSLSRIGYWSFELVVQELTQTLVDPLMISSFAGTQQSFQSFFEFTHWAATTVWAMPRSFPWLGLGSLCAIGASTALYACWVSKRRTHGRSYPNTGDTIAMPYTMIPASNETE